MKTRIVPIGCGAICVALLYAIAIAACAATITVINTNDSGAGSLRQALADANDGDTINFDPALNGQTINLTSAELAIDKNITITGPGPNLLAVSRSSGAFRIFHVMSGHTVIIGGLTISGGNDTANGSGVLNDHAMLTMDSCAVQNSFSQYNSGGGVYNDGSAGSATLTILNSTVSGNRAYSAGGGICNDASNGGSATLTLMNSIMNGNIAYHSENFGGGEGGGIYNIFGTLTITNSTVSGNGAGAPDPFPSGTGGGIYNILGTLTITNSTINSNQCWLAGGGIYNNGTLTISSSTVSGNGLVVNMMASRGAMAAASRAVAPSPTALSATTMLPSQVAVSKAARHWGTPSSTQTRQKIFTAELALKGIISAAMTAAVI